MRSGDATEGTVTPAAVTFTPDNWNAPQTVTVTGVDDQEADGNDGLHRQASGRPPALTPSTRRWRWWRWR